MVLDRLLFILKLKSLLKRKWLSLTECNCGATPTECMQRPTAYHNYCKKEISLNIGGLATATTYQNSRRLSVECSSLCRIFYFDEIGITIGSSYQLQQLISFLRFKAKITSSDVMERTKIVQQISPQVYGSGDIETVTSRRAQIFIGSRFLHA